MVFAMALESRRADVLCQEYLKSVGKYVLLLVSWLLPMVAGVPEDRRFSRRF